MKLTVGATAMKNNFGRYLRHAVTKGEVIIEKNGRPVAKLISIDVVTPETAQPERVFVSDQLLGALQGSGETDYKATRIAALEMKYGRSD